ncbi:hypothetical protein H8R02_23215 [Ramlibacter sp. GTP1]|uniref:L,D-transpeptidase n=1 Tax=Ramlibacter albus TaxID=2079448 RepID=A0A923MCD6_9BURK|nr:hypothetical protein [Ramlibacter albus]
MLLGAGILVLVVPLRMVQQRHAQQATPPGPVVTAPKQAPAQPPVAAAPQAPAAPPSPGLRLADFGKTTPSPDVKLIANWALHTRDNGARSMVIIDKKMARVYVLDPQGRLKASSPALLGEWVGDESTPGVGDKPLSQLKKWEKTTPAGRFVAEMGMNAHHQDVVWVSYDLAVSMHRVIKGLPNEHRAARLASPTHTDNRISNGCVNLPKPFYEKVLAPTVKSTGAIIYVLPDKKSVEEVFKAYDVTSPLQMAQRAPETARAPG